MASLISVTLLDEFSKFITNELGLYFPPQQMNDLEKGIRAASQAFKINDQESCVRWLMSSPLNQSQCEVLACALTIGETYFFRDENLFRALEKSILPTLIQERIHIKQKYIRIWSAGCASGEEPYSIAILLHKLIPDICNWNITLLSTDINTDFLKKLHSGIYSEWSFRGVSQDIKNTYFKNINPDKYEINQEIKQLVDARYLNLAKCHFPALENNTNAMDIILCRNVLMYFLPEIAERIVNNLHHCLIDGGNLIVSSVESPQPYFRNLALLRCDDATIFQRNDDKLPAIQNVNPEPVTFIPEPQVPVIADIAANIMDNENYIDKTNEYANKGQFQEALSWNDKALEENHVDANIYYLRAMILLELDNNDEAVKALNKVIYIDPGFVQAYVVLGNVLKKMKNYREAKKNFEYALSMLSNKNALEMIGDISAGRLIDVIRSTQMVD